jgi:hypothetical protein
MNQRPPAELEFWRRPIPNVAKEKYFNNFEIRR